MSDNIDLRTYYRPQTWDEVIGHDDAVNVLRNLVDSNAAHAYLFSGPSGVGKTTLARITARENGVADADLLEIDGATNTGVDAMREVAAAARYLPMSGGCRGVLIDECHRISAQAFDSLLKILEEPPAHLYWLLCTTRLDKVPATVASRCASIKLRALDQSSLGAILDVVCQHEDLALDPDVADLCIQQAEGSARALLGNIEACRNVTRGWAEAAPLLAAAQDSAGAGKLCRFLVGNNRTWTEAMAICAEIEDEPESVRIVVCNWMAKAASGQKTDRAAIYLIHILQQFEKPYISAEGKAPLYLSIARTLFTSPFA